MKELTERQEEVLLYVDSFKKRNGYSPSVRDVAGHFRITPNGAKCHLDALIKKGMLKSQHRIPRTLVVCLIG